MLNSLVQSDRDHLIHPVVPMREHERRGVKLMKSGEGVWIEDAEGRTYLDGFAGLWCVNAGYGQQSVVDAATRQMSELAYATGYFHFGCEAAVELSRRLVEITPERLDRVFFTLGGSDAVDSAVRFARYYWSVQGQPERQHFIALERGYHGSSTVGSGLTALPVFHHHFAVPLPTQHHLASPYAYRHASGRGEDVIAEGVAALEAKVAELGPHAVAAFIMEPVQGSGGVIVPPEGYLTAMREAARRLSILFIADEVITGFGRTGAPFGCDHEGVSPDMMTLAKGLTSGYAPMGALMVSGEMYETMASHAPDGVPFGHGLTYSGHPVSAAVGLAVLNLYRDGLFENGRRSGEYFERKLRTLLDHALVGEVRSRGLLAAIELVSDKRTRAKPDAAWGWSKRLFDAALAHGVIYRAFSDDVIGLAPALCITPDEIDELVARVRATLDDLLDHHERMTACLTA